MARRTHFRRTQPSGVFRTPRLLALIPVVFLAGCAAWPFQGSAPDPDENGPRPEATTPTAVVELTREPSPTPVPATPTPTNLPPPPIPASTSMADSYPAERQYLSAPGDTLLAIARRFGVPPLDVRCLSEIPGLCLSEPGPELEPGAYSGFSAERLLPPGTLVLLPNFPPESGPSIRLLPDSEVIFSASGEAFDVHAFVQEAGGYLATHRQYLMLNAWNSGADIVELVAVENSVNPRLLLALLEFQCRCVLGMNENPEPFMGVQDTMRHDLYGQMIWAIYHLSQGYYNWRQGTHVEVTLVDGTSVRLHPALNPGTAALYEVFSQLFAEEDFWQAIDPETGFLSVYGEMFGDPWQYELPIFSQDTAQPPLALPFEPGLTWAYTGGPHPAYEGNGPHASLDFAPATADPGCQPSRGWVTAVADGPVIRAEYGAVIQDLDGDGSEQTGWNILYLHIGEDSRVAVGTHLQTGDRIGQPTCEGGVTTGTHLHIARKYNGEWIPAGSGPIPFELDGWIARDGPEVYKGTLEKDGTTLIACTCGWRNGWLEND